MSPPTNNWIAARLAQAVDFSLMTALETLGITKEEVRVLKAAQMEGIGRLGA